MIDEPLLAAVRGVVTASVIAFVIAGHRALFRGLRGESSNASRRTGIVFAAIASAAVVASHVPGLREIVLVAFPVGLALGLGLAVTSLASPSMRSAFDQLTDTDTRLLVSARIGFGAMLFAIAGLGAIPASFAYAAGTGDVVVGCLALALPSTMDRSGSKLVRGILHGIGFLDLVQVVVLAVTVVAPFARARGDAPISLALPWLAVPLMVAVDLHGLRKITNAREVADDGSESPRRVRRALS